MLYSGIHPGLAENIAPDGGPGSDIVVRVHSSRVSPLTPLGLGMIIIEANCLLASVGTGEPWGGARGAGPPIAFDITSWDPTDAGISSNPGWFAERPPVGWYPSSLDRVHHCKGAATG